MDPDKYKSNASVEIPQIFSVVGVDKMHQESGTSVELLFDSLRQSGNAGTRSSTLGLRQLLYRADPYQIDLQLETDRERNRLIVAGQLLEVSSLETASHNVQVALSNLHGNAVNTATNQFGEFRAEVENSGDLELSFLDHSGKRIVILLRGAAQSGVATDPYRRGR